MRNDKEALTSDRGAARRRFIKQSSALLASGLAIGFQLPDAFGKGDNKSGDPNRRPVSSNRMRGCACCRTIRSSWSSTNMTPARGRVPRSLRWSRKNWTSICFASM